MDAEVIKIEQHQNIGNVTWVVTLNNLVYNFLIFDYKENCQSNSHTQICLAQSHKRTGPIGGRNRRIIRYGTIESFME